MMQTVEAIIDMQGRVLLKEKVRLNKTKRALLTILDDEIVGNGESLVGSVEIINEDLESASKEIAELFNRSIRKTEENL